MQYYKKHVRVCMDVRQRITGITMKTSKISEIVRYRVVPVKPVAHGFETSANFPLAFTYVRAQK
jgi:hypothetical protein